MDHVYRISKHEVTNSQYAEFLNAVDPTGSNALSLFNPNMSSNARGGINLNGGAANGSKYVVKLGRNDNPVSYVSFFDAMRFVNWLENGQGSGNIETGVYSIGNGTDESRDPNASFFIPSEDEWYKAAYHKNDGVTGNYWDYATSTDVVPYSDDPANLNTPDDTNVANFLSNDGIANGYNDGFAVTGATVFDGNQNYLTDVGAYSQAQSPYGTFDQGGNVLEWNETVISVSSNDFRGYRGGQWMSSFSFLEASRRDVADPSMEDRVVFGFRVASVIPEPTTCALALAALCLAMSRRRAF